MLIAGIASSFTQQGVASSVAITVCKTGLTGIQTRMGQQLLDLEISSWTVSPQSATLAHAATACGFSVQTAEAENVH